MICHSCGAELIFRCDRCQRVLVELAVSFIMFDIPEYYKCNICSRIFRLRESDCGLLLELVQR
jgi:hypothetical protein